MSKLVSELDLPTYKQDLESSVNYLNSLSKYSAVKTKFNKKEQWQAISIRGYSDEVEDILKPGVLKTEGTDKGLRWTHLYEKPELLPLKEILSHIPAEFERVRVMRLRSGTKISKHTDKVDASIKKGDLVRLHVPLKTGPKVSMTLWEGKNAHSFNLETGKYYYVDVSSPHAVHNAEDFDRLHLVIDCYMNPRLKDVISAGQ
tara:strand:- start:396 stop:1001 length:606 start_codon:yes stop_codon:yes gene_type:complete